jgi:hypothetical protein
LIGRDILSYVSARPVRRREFIALVGAAKAKAGCLVSKPMKVEIGFEFKLQDGG